MNIRVSSVMMLCAAGMASSCTLESEPVGSQVAAVLAPATFTSLVDMNAVDNSLTKSGAYGWTAGAISNEEINGDGAVEFTSGETTTGKMAGLGNGNDDEHYSDLEYAFFLSSSGGIQIYEGGTKVKTVGGSYTDTTVFRIEVLGTTVSYLVDGVSVYSSGTAASFPLTFDCSVNQDGGTINDVEIGTVDTPPFWQNVTDAIATDNAIQKSGLYGWNAGGSSVSTLTDDGYVEFMTDEITTGKMAGLNDADLDQGYAELEHAFFMSSASLIRIYESGSRVYNVPGTYTTSTVFRIDRSAGEVTYWVDGAKVYTSLSPYTGTVVLDTSLNQDGATVSNAVLYEQPFWQNPVDVTVDDNALTKIGLYGWNAGASTSASLAADGYVEFMTGEATTGKMAGLNDADVDQGYAELEHAFFMSSAGLIRIYEGGSNVFSVPGTYTSGTVFKIDRTSGVVTYWVDGISVYTSLAPYVGTVVFDTSLNQVGGTINSVSVVEP